VKPIKKQPTAVAPTPAAKVKYVDGPQYAASYCNNVGYALSALDFVLIFGEVVEATPEEATVERRARITMSPAQAKMLRYIIGQQIKQYEDINGSIEMPQGFKIPNEKADES
jgi:hypothetical protein